MSRATFLAPSSYPHLFQIVVHLLMTTVCQFVRPIVRSMDAMTIPRIHWEKFDFDFQVPRLEEMKTPLLFRVCMCVCVIAFNVLYKQLNLLIYRTNNSDAS